MINANLRLLISKLKLVRPNLKLKRNWFCQWTGTFQRYFPIQPISVNMCIFVHDLSVNMCILATVWIYIDRWLVKRSLIRNNYNSIKSNNEAWCFQTIEWVERLQSSVSIVSLIQKLKANNSKNLKRIKNVAIISVYLYRITSPI